MAKLSKWDRERAQAKARVKLKARAVKRAHGIVDELWKSAEDARHPDGKKLYTEAELEALADASYSLKSIIGGWINHKRR